MSNRSLIAALVVALLLAMAVIATRPRAGSDGQGAGAPASGQGNQGTQSSAGTLADLLGLAEGEVLGLRVSRKTQGIESSERIARDFAGWYYGQGTDPDIQPVDESRVRAFLQFLRQTTTAEGSGAPGDGAITLAIDLQRAGGTLKTVKVEVGATALNGRVPIAIGDRTLSATGDLLKLLAEPGISAWRHSKALATISEARSISIDRSGQRVYSLGKSMAGWMLDEPVQVMADPALVGAIIKQLDSMTVQRYLGVNQVPAGVDEKQVPAAGVEWTIGDGEGAKYRAELFSPATAGGDVFFARIKRVVAGSAATSYWCAVDAKPFTPVLVDPSGLVLPRLSRLNAADIGGVRLIRGARKLTVIRQGETWREQVDEGQMVVLGPKQASEAAGLVELVTSPKATSVDLKIGQGMVAGSESFLELLSPSGETLESYMLSVTTAADGKTQQMRLRRVAEFVYAPVPSVIEKGMERLKE
jgi:hypothetical protein